MKKEKENLPNIGLCSHVRLQSKIERKQKKKKKKRDKYEDLARVIPVAIDVFVIVTKELVKRLKYLEIRGRVETIQIMASLRLARALRRVLETCGDLQSLKRQWKMIS